MRIPHALLVLLRQALPEYNERNNVLTKARRDALEELARRHQEEANDLYARHVRRWWNQ